MKRIMFLLFLCVWMATSAMAQANLQINQVLNGKFSSDPEVTQTFISGGNNKFLKKHHLTVFATFKGPAEKYESQLERLVKKDAERASGKNVRYKGGKLYYGLYSFVLKQKNGRPLYKYIYYLNNGAAGGKNVLVIYMEGNLNEEAAGKLIRSMRKSVK